MTVAYVPQLVDKRVALVVNHSAKVGKTHLLDTLLSLGIDVQKIFSPEHGFRGDRDAGNPIASYRDAKTGLQIVSLYGKQKKPSRSALEEIDLIVFDLQDVGVRFYTYISTLHYVMEAAAESSIPVLVLDRPNPNDSYVDGPVLKPKYKSFVGMHPVPIVYGMTIGEYALMINGEKWLRNGIQAELSVIRCKNYARDMNYLLPISPSPNLPNAQSVWLYPSLALFEGTNVSVGRGTDFPFQVFGSPYIRKDSFSFVPRPTFGASKPKHRSKVCQGKDLREFQVEKKLHLKWLLYAYQHNQKRPFFNKFFTKLAGNELLQNQIEQKTTEESIRKSWKNDIDRFKKTRQKYLIYR